MRGGETQRQNRNVVGMQEDENALDGQRVKIVRFDSESGRYSAKPPTGATGSTTAKDPRADDPIVILWHLSRVSIYSTVLGP